jgi:hypothetical protein
MNNIPLFEVPKTNISGLQENQSLTLILRKKKDGLTDRCRQSMHMECLHIVQSAQVLGTIREQLCRRVTSI